MIEWRDCILGDLVTFQRGHDLPKSKMNGGKYPVVGSNGIIGHHDKYTTEAPSVTVGRSGNVGKPFIYYGKSWSHNTSLYIKDFKGNDPIFIYYFLQTLDLENYAGGSAVPTLNRNHVHSLNVSVPRKVNVQKKIGETLKLIDDKINTNEKINENLSEQAKALFKEKFLVIDCMPLDWKEMTLEDVSILNAGGDKPKVVSEIRSEECTVPIYSNGISNEGIYGFTTDAKIINESVTVSARGTIGFVCLRQEPYVPIVRLISVVPKENIMTAKYLYLWLESLHIMGTGTTQQQLTVPDFKKTRIIVPPIQKIREFTDLVNPIYENILRNKKENEKLSELRDNLLPKLMSGELDVSDLDI